MKDSKPDQSGFLFGAQYYRAPTPDPSCWRKDLDRMRSLGMSSVKLWAQWRWIHRTPSTFVFDDLDRIMALCHEREFSIHINVIFDATPHWLYQRYPDAKPVLTDGTVIEPFEMAARQIGGHPGPSLAHPGALKQRKRFLSAVIRHLRSHPGLAAWDVWNEPELCGRTRSPDPRHLADYNPHNIKAFREWLKKRYASDLSALNNVWGRCYSDWRQVEAPRTGEAYADFVDWRDYHCDLMTSEADWRFGLVAKLDPGRMKFLHVVPSIMEYWNPVGSATDDRALLRNSDVFASTGTGRPWWAPHLVGCADGKTAWNTEVHIAYGATAMHERIIGLATVRRELLPQIGAGIRGFQFWQFRAETLGRESPGWGLVRPDGSDRPLTLAVGEFWKKLAPHAARLASCGTADAGFGLWRSRRNEFHHAAMHGNLDRLRSSYEAWLKACHWRSLTGRTVDSDAVTQGGLTGLRMLIMAEPYYLTQPEADKIAEWVEAGGVLVSEAHLGGYDGTTGRHSSVIPGCGLASRFGLNESESTSTFHLDLYRKEQADLSVSDDVKKASSDGLSGGRLVNLQTRESVILTAAERYAEIACDDAESLAWLVKDRPIVLMKPAGKGWILYAGTDVGLGAELSGDTSGLQWLLGLALEKAGLKAPKGIETPAGRRIRVDQIRDKRGELAFIVCHNDEDSAVTIRLTCQKNLKGVFDDIPVPASGSIILPPRSAEIFTSRP